MSGCSTISDWFAEEEELAIKRLNPIEQKFEIETVWDTSVGNGIENYFSRLRPVESDGVVFVADRQGYLDALDVETGKLLWRVDFATYPEEGWLSGFNKLISRGETARLSSLAIGAGKLFLGTENGDFFALDKEDGSIIWQATVPGEILAPATTSEGFVIINTGGGVLFAFDTATGEEKWRTESDVPPLTLRGISAPLASNGGVMVGTPTGYLQVNVLNSGLTAWETAIAKPSGATELERIVDIDSSPIIFGGVVFVISYNGTLASLELRTGRIIWKREYGSYRNISLDGNTLYVVDVNSNVMALDRRNGIEKWTQGGIKGRRLTAAVPFGDHVVVGDHWGYLHWLNAESGIIESRFDLGGEDEDASVYADPVVANDVLIAVTRDGEVAALKPASAN
jgi:outer membrane protein assembly factor BamB